MTKTRLEAFSDGVIAIIITIMVLELRPPHDGSPAALGALTSVFLSYVLSFTNVGMYWTNHHHMLHSVKSVNGPVLWANLHLLFWLSLFPAATSWMGNTHFAMWPIVVYGFVSLMSGTAYYILARVLIRSHGASSEIARALGRDVKGKASVVMYIVGIGVSFLNPWLGLAVYVLVAAMWFVPDRRFER